MRARRKLVMMFAGGGLTHASGGVGTFIRYLRDEWANKPGTPEVRVVDTRGPGGKASMALHFFKAIGLLLCWGCIGRIDLMHIHLAAYGSALRKGVLILIGDMLGIPVVVHMHGSNFYKFYADLPGPCQKALRFILNRARYVVVLGDDWRQFLISSIGIEPDKIAIIVNGVPGPGDIDRSQAAHRASCRIVFLGQIGERKGVPDLLAAFQTPRLLARSWTATVAGDGEVDEFRAAIAEAGLQDRVSGAWMGRSRSCQRSIARSGHIRAAFAFRGDADRHPGGNGSWRSSHSHAGRRNSRISDRRSDCSFGAAGSTGSTSRCDRAADR